ncbi:MAG: hypothetical protein HN590_05885 [Calditrichaeota bacterium]|nr:hypothetical protein [Calditrichota bacterium]MBT7789708.1 hypothetical protein [Calditrichota bacterium]
MKKYNTLKLFICILIATFAVMGCGGGDDLTKYTKIVTFKSAEKAPRDFDSWSFFWQSPTSDSDSKLEYVVLNPDGKIYIQKSFSGSGMTTPGVRNRLDFKKDYAGGDPKLFLRKEVNFSFRAQKGDIVFDQNGLYYFKFFKGGFEGTEVAVMDAVSDQVKKPTR